MAATAAAVEAPDATHLELLVDFFFNYTNNFFRSP